jgi:hypothetical protein
MSESQNEWWVMWDSPGTYPTAKMPLSPIANLHTIPPKASRKFGGLRIKNKRSVASSGRGVWRQVLTMLSADILGHLGHMI